MARTVLKATVVKTSLQTDQSPQQENQQPTHSKKATKESLCQRELRDCLHAQHILSLPQLTMPDSPSY